MGFKTGILMALTSDDFNYDDMSSQPEVDEETNDNLSAVMDEEAEGASADGEESTGYFRRKSRWYAVQVASGCEKRVKLNFGAADQHAGCDEPGLSNRNSPNPGGQAPQRWFPAKHRRKGVPRLRFDSHVHG